MVASTAAVVGGDRDGGCVDDDDGDDAVVVGAVDAEAFRSSISVSHTPTWNTWPLRGPFILNKTLNFQVNILYSC